MSDIQASAESFAKSLTDIHGVVNSGTDDFNNDSCVVFVEYKTKFSRRIPAIKPSILVKKIKEKAKEAGLVVLCLNVPEPKKASVFSEHFGRRVYDSNIITFDVAKG